MLALQNYASTYAKIAIFVFGALGGGGGVGIVAGIVVGSTVWCIGYSAAEMLQVCNQPYLCTLSLNPTPER